MSRRLNALVIGNAAYQAVDPLKNAVNDAEDVGAKLEGCGFGVVRSLDSSHAEMDRALRQFQRVLKESDVGLHAGLAAGFALLGFDPASILGFTVLHGAERAHADTLDKSNQTARLLSRGICIESEGIAVDGRQLGQGYGIPTDAMLKAVSGDMEH